MSIWHITGGSPLRGQIRVQGSKNAVLPVIAASLLCGAETELLNCPNLSDVDAAMDILRYLGCTAARCGDALCIDTTAPARCDIPRELMHRMRSSVIFLGPLLARFGEAEVSLPGGCELGPRPIDLHLHALRLLGAEIEEGEDSIVCRASHLRGAEISLALPSVGATENAMIAACAAEGTTVIYNAAREPEIRDLQNFINALGGKVRGGGTDRVTIELSLRARRGRIRRRLACHPDHRLFPALSRGTSHPARPDRRGNVSLLHGVRRRGDRAYRRRARTDRSRA